MVSGVLLLPYCLYLLSATMARASNFCTEHNNEDNRTDVYCMINCEVNQTFFEIPQLINSKENVYRLGISIWADNRVFCPSLNSSFLRQFPALESFWIYNQMHRLDLNGLFDYNPLLKVVRICAWYLYEPHKHLEPPPTSMAKRAIANAAEEKVWPIQRFVCYGSIHENFFPTLWRMRASLEEVELDLVSSVSWNNHVSFEWSEFPRLQKVMLKQYQLQLPILFKFHDLQNLRELQIMGYYNNRGYKNSTSLFQHWKGISLKNLPQLSKVSLKFSSSLDSSVIQCANVTGDIEQLELIYMPLTLLVQCPYLWQCKTCGQHNQKQSIVLSTAGDIAPQISVSKKSLDDLQTSLQLHDVLPAVELFPHFNTTHLYVAVPSFTSLEKVNFTRFPSLEVYHHYENENYRKHLEEGIFSVVKLHYFASNVFQDLPNPHLLQSLRLTVGHCGGGIKDLIWWFHCLSPQLQGKTLSLNETMQRSCSTFPENRTTPPVDNKKELLLHCENMRDFYAEAFGESQQDSWQDLDWLMEHLPNDNSGFISVSSSCWLLWWSVGFTLITGGVSRLLNLLP